MTDTLKLTPTESVTIRSSTPEALEVEAEYGPDGSPPPKHWHPAQDERFRVLEGTLRARVDGIEREYRDVFRLAGPDTLLRGAFAVLAIAGRARGYRVHSAG